MRFVIQMGDATTLFTFDQLNQLIDLLDKVEVVQKEWVGKPTSPTGYIDKISHMTVKEMLNLKVMSQVEYDALVVRTELSKEAK